MSTQYAGVSTKASPTEYRDLSFLGFTDYLVGDDGSVWSCKSGKWKRRALDHDHRGYPTVKLAKNGKTTSFRLHSVVLRAFVGDRPEGMEGCHNNGSVTDCRLINLRWDTKQGNCNDTVRHGRSTRGEKHAHAKITESIVLAIRRRHACESITQTALAREYGLSITHVCAIIHGKRWGWVIDTDEQIAACGERLKKDAPPCPDVA